MKAFSDTSSNISFRNLQMNHNLVRLTKWQNIATAQAQNRKVTTCNRHLDLCLAHQFLGSQKRNPVSDGRIRWSKHIYVKTN